MAPQFAISFTQQKLLKSLFVIDSCWYKGRSIELVRKLTTHRLALSIAFTLVPHNLAFLAKKCMLWVVGQGSMNQNLVANFLICETFFVRAE